MASPSVSTLVAFGFGAALLHTAHLQHLHPDPRVAPHSDHHLYRYEASRLSMACVYAIEAYGADEEALPRILDEAFDEVDRIDRLMSHYKASSALSRVNREAGRHPVTVDAELFDFLESAMRYNRDSRGAFDITVGPLMKAWGFFQGEGHVPSDDELQAARRHVGGSHVRLNSTDRTVSFDEAGVELDLGGIAKGYAVDRVVDLLKRRGIAAALVSSGGSTIYGFGAPPAREGWDVAIQDPIDPRKTALTVRLKDRALSVAGRSEKWFEADGTRYTHIMDPRTGRPVQGILSVAVLAASGTAGDALDDAFFVLGPDGSQSCLDRLPGTEALFFLPDAVRSWKMIHRRAARETVGDWEDIHEPTNVSQDPRGGTGGRRVSSRRRSGRSAERQDHASADLSAAHPQSALQSEQHARHRRDRHRDHGHWRRRGQGHP